MARNDSFRRSGLHSLPAGGRGQSLGSNCAQLRASLYLRCQVRLMIMSYLFAACLEGRTLVRCRCCKHALAGSEASATHLLRSSYRVNHSFAVCICVTNQLPEMRILCLSAMARSSLSNRSIPLVGPIYAIYTVYNMSALAARVPCGGCDLWRSAIEITLDLTARFLQCSRTA